MAAHGKAARRKNQCRQRGGGMAIGINGNVSAENRRRIVSANIA